MLFVVIGRVDQHFLVLVRLRCSRHLRHFFAFAQVKLGGSGRILRYVRIEVGNEVTCYLKTFEVGVIELSVVVLYGIFLCRFLSRFHRDTPFTLCELAEEDHLCVLCYLIAEFRIRQAGSQIVDIIMLRSIETIDETTVGVDTQERVVRRSGTVKDDVIDTFVLAIRHADISY